MQIVEADDLFGDESDKEHSCLTDGAGRISVDLMRGMPSLESGRLCAEQRVDEDDEPEERSAALVVQGRLWYLGSLAKGLWVIDSTLPARTIVVGKQKQRKIDGCACRAGSLPFAAVHTHTHSTRLPSAHVTHRRRLGFSSMHVCACACATAGDATALRRGVV